MMWWKRLVGLGTWIAGSHNMFLSLAFFWCRSNDKWYVDVWGGGGGGGGGGGWPVVTTRVSSCHPPVEPKPADHHQLQSAHVHQRGLSCRTREISTAATPAQWEEIKYLVNWKLWKKCQGFFLEISEPFFGLKWYEISHGKYPYFSLNKGLGGHIFFF